MKKKYWIALVIIFLVLFLLYFFVLRRKPVEVKLAPVIKKTLVATIAEEGAVRSIKEASLAFKTGGRLISVLSEGTRVKKGQLLAQLAAEEVQAQFKQAQAGYLEAENNGKRDRALRQQGIISAQQYQASQTRFAVAEEQLKSARSLYEGSFIYAPFEGVVAQKYLELGELTSPGQPALVLIDDSQVYVEIQIDENDISSVKTGEEVTVSADAYPDVIFKGKVVLVNPQAELKKIGGQVRLDEKDMVFRSKVEVIDPDKKLKSGMTVYVDIPTQTKANVLTVPREAVFNKDGKNFVFIIKGRRVLQKPVEVGIKSIQEMEITKGMAAGEKVATINLEKLKNKSRVKILK